MSASRLTAVAALLLVAAARVHAQASSPDSLPFSRGEWGVEAPIGGGGGGVGALRFLTRATALTLNFAAAHSTSTFNGQNVVGDVPTQTSNNLSANLGVRHYKPLGSSLAAYGTIGGTFVYQHNHSEPGASDTHQTGWGGFADAGVSFFATRHVALSGAYGISGARFGSKVTSNQGFPQTAHTWSLQTGGVRAVASIFF